MSYKLIKNDIYLIWFYSNLYLSFSFYSLSKSIYCKFWTSIKILPHHLSCWHHLHWIKLVDHCININFASTKHLSICVKEIIDPFLEPKLMSSPPNSSNKIPSIVSERVDHTSDCIECFEQVRFVKKPICHYSNYNSDTYSNNINSFINKSFEYSIVSPLGILGDIFAFCSYSIRVSTVEWHFLL